MLGSTPAYSANFILRSPSSASLAVSSTPPTSTPFMYNWYSRQTLDSILHEIWTRAHDVAAPQTNTTIPGATQLTPTVVLTLFVSNSALRLKQNPAGNNEQLVRSKVTTRKHHQRKQNRRPPQRRNPSCHTPRHYNNRHENQTGLISQRSHVTAPVPCDPVYTPPSPPKTAAECPTQHCKRLDPPYYNNKTLIIKQKTYRVHHRTVSKLLLPTKHWGNGLQLYCPRPSCTNALQTIPEGRWKAWSTP